ncbi:MAG: nucleoside hydrolase [Candidatus Helarchaeota archaeon]|nr:nucleoside hydrolase [Candidatus Helarchaeota archaeon]
MQTKRILIDADPAISIPRSDIDDGLAIFMALNSPELNVEGITTVYGNSSLEKVTAVAKDVLKVADRQDSPVFKGAYNKKWLGIKLNLDKLTKFKCLRYLKEKRIIIDLKKFYVFR